MVLLVSSEISNITPIITQENDNSDDLDDYPTKNLPDAVILFDILPRLDLGTVFRAKTVSRMCREVIDSQYFQGLNRPFLVGVSGVENHYMSILEKPVYEEGGNRLEVLSWDKGLSIRKGNLTNLTVPHSFNLVGSVNGIICLFLASNENFWLWNPITRRVRVILPQDFDESDPVRSFGFGNVNGEYVIIAGYYSSMFRVYSLATETWEILLQVMEGFSGVEILGRGFSGGDSLYWGWNKWEHIKGLVRFDLVKRQISLMELPSWMNYPFTLQNLWPAADDNGLFIYCRYDDKTSDLWTLIGEELEFKFSVVKEGRDGMLLGPIQDKLLFHKNDLLRKIGKVGVYDMVKGKYVGRLSLIDKETGTYWSGIPFKPTLEDDFM